MSESFKKTALHDDIYHLEGLLTPEQIQAVLDEEQSVRGEKEANYAGKSYRLPDELAHSILQRLKLFGIEFEKLAFARLRVATHEDINDFRSLVHTDQNCRRAVVVYVMNTLYKLPAEAGTLFWEHSLTRAKKIDLKNPRSVFLHSLAIERDTKDLTKWIGWLACPFKENTAVVFDSMYFHSPPSPLFDKNSPGKRITLDLFLD